MIFRYFQCLQLMYSEVVWVLVSSRNQVQSQIILDPDYLPDYLSVSYDCVLMRGANRHRTFRKNWNTYSNHVLILSNELQRKICTFEVTVELELDFNFFSQKNTLKAFNAKLHKNHFLPTNMQKCNKMIKYLWSIVSIIK